MSETDDVEETPSADEHDDTPRRKINWKKLNVGGMTYLLAIGLFVGACVCLRVLRWATCDGTWLCSPRTKTVTVVSGAAPVTSTRLPSTTAEAPTEQVVTEQPAPASVAGSSRQLGPYSAAPAVTTVAPNLASKAGMGDLWLNVCGNLSSGYRMCRGSTPTEAQRAADFPPGAKNL